MHWKSKGSYLEAHDKHTECYVSMTSDGIVLLVKPRDEQFYGCYSLYQFPDRAAEVFTAMTYGDVLAKQIQKNLFGYWKNPKDSIRCQAYDGRMDDEWQHMKKLKSEIFWISGHLETLSAEEYARITDDRRKAIQIEYAAAAKLRSERRQEYAAFWDVRTNRNMLITVQSVLNDSRAD